MCVFLIGVCKTEISSSEFFQMQKESTDIDQAEAADIDAISAMDTSEPAKGDYVMQDPEFLPRCGSQQWGHSICHGLPGFPGHGVEVRSESPQTAPPWHANYF